MAVVILYSFAVIFAILTFWGLLVMTKGQRSTYFVLLFGTVFVVNLAHLALSISTNIGEAVMANRFTYLGGTFLVMFLFLSMCELCKIKVRSYITVPMILLNSEILAQVFISDFSDAHYKSVRFVREDGFTQLIKEGGPHHTFYQIVLCCYMMALVGIVVYAFIARRKVSWKYTLLLSMGGVISMGFYFLVRIAGIRVELLPFAYIVCECMFLLIVGRMKLFNVSQNAATELPNIIARGYVVIDSKIRFVGCDDLAKKYFPELGELEIDRVIKNQYLLSEFGEWIRASKIMDVEPKLYQRNGCDVKVSVRPLYWRKSHHIGYVMEVEDDTQNQKYIRNLYKLLNTDQLTGIFNRHSFEEEFNSLDPSKEPVTIAAFDVNELKSINDRLGHGAGDALIIAASTCILKTFGKYGKCFRTGGDEFVAIMHGASGRMGEISAEFDKNIKNAVPEGTEGLTISYGYCDSVESPNLSAKEMLALADKRMYEDKSNYYVRSGKDRRRH